MRTAARDSSDPSGKSPGRKAVASSGVIRWSGFNNLSNIFAFVTVGSCRTQSVRPPTRQNPVLGVGFQFGLGHAIEQSIEIYGLGALHPFAAAVDSRIGANSTHHRSSIY